MAAEVRVAKGSDTQAASEKSLDNVISRISRISEEDFENAASNYYDNLVRSLLNSSNRETREKAREILSRRR